MSDISAFPQPYDRAGDGMTLRDWFAGQALAGLCASHGSYGIGNGPGELANRAYDIADAVLTARTGDRA